MNSRQAAIEAPASAPASAHVLAPLVMPTSATTLASAVTAIPEPPTDIPATVPDRPAPAGQNPQQAPTPTAQPIPQSPGVQEIQTPPSPQLSGFSHSSDSSGFDSGQTIRRLTAIKVAPVRPRPRSTSSNSDPDRSGEEGNDDGDTKLYSVTPSTASPSSGGESPTLRLASRQTSRQTSSPARPLVEEEEEDIYSPAPVQEVINIRTSQVQSSQRGSDATAAPPVLPPAEQELLATTGQLDSASLDGRINSNTCPSGPGQLLDTQGRARPYDSSMTSSELSLESRANEGRTNVTAVGRSSDSIAASELGESWTNVDAPSQENSDDDISILPTPEEEY